MRREPMGLGLVAAVAAASALLGAAPAAEAQRAAAGCFRVQGDPDSARRAQHLVGLTSIVRLDAGCEYAPAARGPWVSAGALASRDTDFLELLHHVTAASPAARDGGDPRFLFGRPASAAGRAGEAPQQTLILRYCAHYLLEEQLGFRAQPVGAEGGVRLERTAGAEAAQCDADRVELRAVSGSGDAALAVGGDGARTLAVGQRTLELPRGDWAVYAARPGGRVGLRVGVFRPTSTTTPLRRHLRSLAGGAGPGDRAAPPLLAARWSPEASGVALVPTTAALDEPLLWAELRTAADAGLLWLARADAGGAAPRVLGAVSLEGSRPPSVRIPDVPVREIMERRYGRAGASMTPTFEDWSDIVDELSLCLTPSYLDQQTAAIGAAAPDPGACGPLAGLVSLEAPEAGGAARPRACLDRGFQILGARGARREGVGEPVCFDLPGPGEPMPHRLTIVGDRLTLLNAGSACVLVDNEPLVARDGGFDLDRGGLLEVRFGGGEGCMSGQALARLRLAVVDPQHDVHPVGFGGSDADAVRCLDEEGRDLGGTCPWRALRHDEPEIFAYVRSRNSLALRLSASPAAAAAINGSASPRVALGQDIPLLAGVEGAFDGPPQPALVAFVSHEPECPSGEGQSVAEIARREPVEPDGEPVDRLFHVFVAAVEGLDQPPHCIARATFRVRPSRAFVTAQAGRALGLEIGVLGDVQAVFFFAPGPVALGLAVPAAYLRLNLFPIRQQRWLAFEIAGNLVFAAAFDPAGVARTGASLSAAIQLGVPRWVPRLLSIGVMLHGAFESVPDDPDDPARDTNPIWGVYAGLDLSTLIDLAGGR